MLESKRVIGRCTAARSWDCFSRMIVARTFSTTADTALVNNAVNMAADSRNRSGPTILHANQDQLDTLFLRLRQQLLSQLPLIRFHRHGIECF